MNQFSHNETSMLSTVRRLLCMLVHLYNRPNQHGGRPQFKSLSQISEQSTTIQFDKIAVQFSISGARCKVVRSSYIRIRAMRASFMKPLAVQCIALQWKQQGGNRMPAIFTKPTKTASERSVQYQPLNIKQSRQNRNSVKIAFKTITCVLINRYTA